MKIIPINKTKASILRSIITQRETASIREKDFIDCILSDNDLTKDEIKSLNISDDFSAIIIEKKDGINNIQ